MGGRDLMEFRGQHYNVWEFLEAVECSPWCGEESNQHNVAFTDSMVFQNTNGCTDCGTTLCSKCVVHAIIIYMQSNAVGGIMDYSGSFSLPTLKIAHIW